MNNNNNDSLIEIAFRVMKSKRKEQPLAKICKEVFEIKGIKPEDFYNNAFFSSLL